MRKFAKSTAALALAAVMTTALTGCGGDQSSTAQQSGSAVQNSVAGRNSSAENTSAPLLDMEDILRSKITSADSTAMSLANTVNTWLLDNMTFGGLVPGEGEDTVVFDNGNVTVSGVVTDADTKKLTSGFETLSEKLKTDFSYIKTAYVKLYINGSGNVYACVFVEEETDVDKSDIPDKDALSAGEWKWDGKTAGVSPSGKIVGTYPRTALAGQ